MGRLIGGFMSGTGPLPPSGIPVSDLPVGTLVKSGLDGVDTNLLLIHKNSPSSLYDGFENTVTLLFQNIIEGRPWHNSDVNSYADSAIHAHLNGGFLSTLGFSDLVKQVKIPYRPGSGTTSTINSGANGLAAKVWLLSGYEVNWTTSASQYFPVDGATLSYFAGTATTDAKRIAYLNSTATTWWLRSPFTAGATNAWRVTTNGFYNSNGGCSSSGGIRPALALPNTSLVEGDPNPDGSYNLIV